MGKKDISTLVGQLAMELSREIGDHKVIDDRDLLESLSFDESHCEPRVPDLAVRARDARDVESLLRLALKFEVPVTARGGGTGKSGGAIPVRGGVVLDCTRMNKVIEVDKNNLLAVVQPGVITGIFQEDLESEGLFYPPDPNSLETCTIGGNAAHNAGGPRAFKYGVTREYVLGTETAFMGGLLLKTGRRTVKGVAGYDITGLLVGSEGTLGIFTSLTLRLRKKPEHLSTLLVRMPDEIAGGRAVASIVAAGLVPRVLEFMDALSVQVLRESGVGGINESTGTLLLAEFDGTSKDKIEADVLRFADLCEREGADEVLMARHGTERSRLWTARRSLSDALKKQAAFKTSQDIVVPRFAAPKLLKQLKQLGKTHKVLMPAYGHAGDGNYHVNILWDDPDFDSDHVVADLFKLTLSLGGTITGEHGIGLAKKKYLPMEFPSEMLALQRRIKEQFDPKSLLNPGKIF